MTPLYLELDLSELEGKYLAKDERSGYCYVYDSPPILSGGVWLNTKGNTCILNYLINTEKLRSDIYYQISQGELDPINEFKRGQAVLVRINHSCKPCLRIFSHKEGNLYYVYDTITPNTRFSNVVGYKICAPFDLEKLNG